MNRTMSQIVKDPRELPLEDLCLVSGGDVLGETFPGGNVSHTNGTINGNGAIRGGEVNSTRRTSECGGIRNGNVICFPDVTE